MSGPRCSSRQCAMCSRCRSPVQTRTSGAATEADMVRSASATRSAYAACGQSGQPTRGKPRHSACRQITSTGTSWCAICRLVPSKVVSSTRRRRPHGCSRHKARAARKESLPPDHNRTSNPPAPISTVSKLPRSKAGVLMRAERFSIGTLA
eukprot:scaffold35708_cov129-Isochrysis_galbana.AAC.2